MLELVGKRVGWVLAPTRRLPLFGVRASTHPTRLRLLIVLGLGACLVGGGCVQRRMMIRTNPPGARVFVDDYEIGTSPVSHNFTYYGGRKIRLVKDGYETLTVMQHVPTPWYEIPPLDFVSETLIPLEIRDQQTFSYQLTPQMVVPTEQLMGRAEQLRGQVRSTGGVAPAPINGPVQMGPTPAGPQYLPTPIPSEPIPPPSGVGGQPVYPLPPSGR